MKSIRNLLRQDREKYVIPRRVQDVIPIQKIWEDGIFLTGGRYAKTFRFTDINYQVASEPDKEKMFRGYSALINSLDCGATTKITIFNHKMSHPFPQTRLCGRWKTGFSVWRQTSPTGSAARTAIAKRSIAHTVAAISDGISRKASDAPSTNGTGNRKIAIMY